MSRIKKLKKQILELHDRLFALSCTGPLGRQEHLSDCDASIGVLEAVFELVRKISDAIDDLESLAEKKGAKIVELEHRIAKLERAH